MHEKIDQHLQEMTLQFQGRHRAEKASFQTGKTHKHKQTCIFARNTYTACDGDDDELHSSMWALPIKLKRFGWFQLVGPTDERQFRMCWHIFCLCVCISTLLDILILVAAQDGGTTRVRTWSRLTYNISLVQEAAGRILRRVSCVAAFASTLQGTHGPLMHYSRSKLTYSSIMSTSTQKALLT